MSQSLNRNKIVIGINAYHADSAACLIVNGKLLAAIEEERINRIKHWSGFPIEAIKFCISQLDQKKKLEIDLVFNSSSSSRFSNKFISLIKNPLLIFRGVKSIKKNISIKKNLKKLFELFPDIKFITSHNEHHYCHIIYSYYASKFDVSSFLSLDGFGDFKSSRWGYVSDGKFIFKGETRFPHSLGILYQAITQFLGFLNYGDEYKVMGMAAYGKNIYSDKIKKLVKYIYPASYELNLKYFSHHKSEFDYDWNNPNPNIPIIFNDDIIDLLGRPRLKNDKLNQYHYDIACSLQSVYTEILSKILIDIKSHTNVNKICISGGCALNSMANGDCSNQNIFKSLFVPASPGDSGGSIGAALSKFENNSIDTESIHSAYTGITYTNNLIKKEISKMIDDTKFNIIHFNRFDDLTDHIANLLTKEKVIGWYQNSSEWGPRALGNRSIIVDPRMKDAKDLLNLKIKKRESFRPFAPSILYEYQEDWFVSNVYSPYMSYVIKFKKNKGAQVPPVCHVDGSGRLQSVTEKNNSRYYELINKFYKITGVPILLNTSFNENEPIVNKPSEAIDCFLRTNMDVLVLNDYVVIRD
jgi:carbamoyltransferase